MLFLLILSAGSQGLSGQNEESRKGQWYALPEAGLQLGYVNYLDLSTLFAYHLTDRLSVGGGPHLCWYLQKGTVYNPESFSTFLFGARLMTRLSLIRHGERFIPFGLLNELFLHAEYEALNLERAYFDYPQYPESGRFWLHSLFAGAGITQSISPSVSFYYMALFDFSGGINTVYSNPQYRIGMNIYF